MSRPGSLNRQGQLNETVNASYVILLEAPKVEIEIDSPSTVNNKCGFFEQLTIDRGINTEVMLAKITVQNG